MAKKKLPKPAKVKHFCKDCERLKINTQNLNWEGKPFIGDCLVDGWGKIMSVHGCETNFKKKICR